MGADFTIGLASVADAPALARDRAEMFRDMGELPDELYDPLLEAARRMLSEWLGTGEYVAWGGCPPDHPDQIVAGGGGPNRRAVPRAPPPPPPPPRPPRGGRGPPLPRGAPRPR